MPENTWNQYVNNFYLMLNTDLKHIMSSNFKSSCKNADNDMNNLLFAIKEYEAESIKCERVFLKKALLEEIGKLKNYDQE
jgi:hypothetical protein